MLRQSHPLSLLLFERMLSAAGPRQWWPCERSGPGCGRDEIIIGAILTQNTSWKNVEQALASLKRQGLCDLAKLAVLPAETIAPLIRPAGYFNLKAKRLKAVAEFFAPGGAGRFDELAGMPTEILREEILSVYGVGRETADSILLYALKRLTFVIDAYTLRIGQRHGLFGAQTRYEEARSWFTANLPHEPDATGIQLFNEYHALLVWIGNNFCKPTPRCGECPLNDPACFTTKKAWQALRPYRQKK